MYSHVLSTCWHLPSTRVIQARRAACSFAGLFKLYMAVGAYSLNERTQKGVPNLWNAPCICVLQPELKKSFSQVEEVHFTRAESPFDDHAFSAGPQVQQDDLGPRAWRPAVGASLDSLPMFWFHVPNVLLVSHTSDIPQNDMIRVTGSGQPMILLVLVSAPLFEEQLHLCMRYCRLGCKVLECCARTWERPNLV